MFSDTTPNPSKVRIILEELGLPYQSSFVELENLRKEPYGSINPNGRVPGMTLYFRLHRSIRTTRLSNFFK